MREDQARNLVKKTLEKPFDKVQFGILLKNLLNKMDETKAFRKPQTGQYIAEAFRDSVKSLDRIGQYKNRNADRREEVIDILIVHLKKEVSLKTARTTQRNYIARYLKEDRGGQLKDGALVAFVSPGGEDWRFSFVQIDYRFDEQGKIKDELTPARRHSFLVGENERSHTAQSALVPLLKNDDQNPSLKDLEEAFSVEKATKEFFEKYRSLFLTLKETLDKTIEKDKNIKAEFENKGIKSSDFSKKLLGQIVFLYFLQKKGWFGVERGAEWGTGSKDFLREELFNRRDEIYKSQGPGISKNFFNDILEPLFYEALSKEHEDDYYSRFDRRIPFLNGGLFEPLRGYDWVNKDILLPDSLFSNKNQTKEGDGGDGILDVFDRYNFTVNEDEPLEKEVAVDPEMLGKVFENLLEVKDRKSKGTYYTPREIVHYMCQESLINYLAEELKGNVKKEEVEKFIKISDSSVEHDAVYQERQNLRKEAACLEPPETSATERDKEAAKGGKRHPDNKIHGKAGGKARGRYGESGLPAKIRENAGLIDEKLAEIRVCDPAVGSGAFPVGMMNEIVRARTALTPFIASPPDKGGQGGVPPENTAGQGGLRTPYHFKRHAVEHGLYGADIDSGAVEIAKLRLWLSLVVDEEDRKTVQPLPNLNYKMVCGDSLLGLNKDDGLGTKDGFYELNIKEFHKKKRLYFNETSVSKKKKLKEEINKLMESLFRTNGVQSKENPQNSNSAGEAARAATKPFDFEMYFSEVFQEKGGFDIVIANPPYLKERNNKSRFELIKQTEWGKKWYQGKMDYWYFFLHRAIDISKESGSISFITSRYWLNSSGAKKLIARVKSKLAFAAFADIGKLKVFDEVAGQHMAAVYLKGRRDTFIYRKLTNNLSDLDKIKENENLKIKLLSNSKVFSDDHIRLTVDKLNYRGVVPLGNVFDVSQGIVQNPDKVSRKSAEKYNLPAGKGVFVLSDKELNELSLTKNEKSFVKLFFEESDVQKYLVSGAKRKRLLYLTKENCQSISQYPQLKQHLQKYKKIMLSRRETRAGKIKWFHLHWPRKNYYFNREKIVLPGMFDVPRAGYQKTEGYFGLSSNIIIAKSDKYKLKFLLAILNSQLAQYWFRNHGKKRGIGADIGVSKLREFPVKKTAYKTQKPLIDLIDKILAITKTEDYLQNPAKQASVQEYEKQIDKLVYKLYSLSPEEIKIIEDS